MGDLALSIGDLHRQMCDGELTSVDLVQSSLETIEALNPELHAFIDVFADTALEQARHCDALLGQGAALLGPLHGIPVGIKDIIDVEGQPTTAHSRVPAAKVARKDAQVVQMLRSAGAVVLGKTALHEYATGGPSHDLPFPAARNPSNPLYHPGGSSSGSGAAVASGMVPAALGTDTAGSVRHPATVCGIVGLKPTYDAISRAGMFPLAQSLDHVGVLAQDVESCARVYDACRQPHAPSALVRLGEDVAGKKVGVIEEFGAAADPEQQGAVETARRCLEAAGAIVVPLSMPKLEVLRDCARYIIQAESYGNLKEKLLIEPDAFASRTKRKVLAGAFIEKEDYLDVQRHRMMLAKQVDQALADVDAALSVSSLTLPALINDDAGLDATYDREARSPFNLSGHPAICLPVGRARDNLSVGVQVIARYHGEATAFTMALAIERAL